MLSKKRRGKYSAKEIDYLSKSCSREADDDSFYAEEFFAPLSSPSCLHFDELSQLNLDYERS